MNRRLIIISIVTLVLLLAIGLAVWLLQQEPTTDTVDTNTNDTTTNTNTTVTTTNTDTSTDTTTDATTVAVDRDDRQAITSVSSSFTKRFGSYSTDTNFENIERSRYLMTTTMSDQADRIIQAGQNNDTAGDTFSSVDSVVTGVTITDFADGATGATVEVSVRQTQRIGQGTTNYANAKARATLKKEGDRWLVDSFRWL